MARAGVIGVVLAVLGTALTPASADSVLRAPQPTANILTQNVFFFAGASVDEDMFGTFNLFGADYEDNALVGGGYQRFFYETLDISFGVEAGLAGRFGDTDSLEVWGGVVARYDGLVLFDRVKFAPALTFGLSAVTDTLAGRETRREIEDNGDATLLFYLSPEFNFSLVEYPNVEVFWRLHHRSGAKGTLGDMEGATNANVFGMRVGF